MSIVAYHGTRVYLPFSKFDASALGSGIVSNGAKGKYGGFFFTTERDNALYYTEYFILKVRINNVFPSPLDSDHPPTVMKEAVADSINYMLENVVDGHIPSDIIVVPTSNLEDIEILSWEFVGDKEDVFSEYDELFGYEDGYLDPDYIEEVLHVMGKNLDYLLSIPVFKEYYESYRVVD